MGGNFVKMSGISQNTVYSDSVGKSMDALSPKELKKKEFREKAKKDFAKILEGLLFDLFGIKSNLSKFELSTHQLADLYIGIEYAETKEDMLFILKPVLSKLEME